MSLSSFFAYHSLTYLSQNRNSHPLATDEKTDGCQWGWPKDPQQGSGQGTVPLTLSLSFPLLPVGAAPGGRRNVGFHPRFAPKAPPSHWVGFVFSLPSLGLNLLLYIMQVCSNQMFWLAGNPGVPGTWDFWYLSWVNLDKLVTPHAIIYFK